jgi:hypothetical protein
MLSNINAETGVRYGVISAANIDPEIIDMIEMNGENLSAHAALEQIRIDVNEACNAGTVTEENFDSEVDRRMSEWHENAAEEVYRFVEYGDDGLVDVEIHTGWLGGAQHLFVIRSPFMCFAAQCSPCVPNAGDLDTRFDDDSKEGTIACYDVPPDWRASDIGESVETEEDENFDNGEDLQEEWNSTSLYEITLTGFDASSDETDDRVLWVVTNMSADDLAAWLIAQNVTNVKVTPMVRHPSFIEDIDFDLPEEAADFVARVNAYTNVK